MQNLVQSNIVSGADVRNGHLQGLNFQGRTVLCDEHKSVQFGESRVISCIGLKILIINS